MTYLQILILIYIVFLLLNKIFGIVVYSKIITGVVFSAIFLFWGYFWDSYAVSAGHWIFNEQHLLGVWVGKLPLEEYLFFIIVPYGSISVYKLANKYLFKNK